MERYFNVKYVLYEAKRKLKWILLISIVFALLFTAYSYINIQKQRENQRYGAYCELYVEYGQSNNIYLINDKNIDISSFTLPVVKSDAFFKSLSEDSEIKEKKITEDDLKTMIYPISKSGGTVIKISTAASDSETAELLCEKAMQDAWDLYESKGFEVSAQHETEALGTVVIETEDDTENPHETISYVNKTNEIMISPIDLAIKGLVGFILGIIGALVCIIGIFFFSDKITYSEQIIENLELKLLSNSQNSSCFLELYSNLVMNDNIGNSLFFMSLQKSNSGKTFLKSFIEFMGDKGNNVLLIDIEEDCSDKELHVYDKGKYSYGELNIKKLFDPNDFTAILDKLNHEYDYIFIECENVKNNPMAKLICKYVNGTVLVIESDLNTVRDISTTAEELVNLGVLVLGCIFVD